MRALGREVLTLLQRGGVDHVDAARRLDDADIDPPAVLADGDVVRDGRSAGSCLMTFSVFASTTSSVLSASSLT